MVPHSSCGGSGERCGIAGWGGSINIPRIAKSGGWRRSGATLEAFHDVERWSLVWGEGLVLGGGASEVEVVWAAEDEDGKTATFLVTPIVG